MGWSAGRNAEGREVGYAIRATCDQEGCTAKIDRGLAYVCGSMHDGGEHGCGRYLCGEHLAYYWDEQDEDGETFQFCDECGARYDASHPEPDPEPPDTPSRGRNKV